MMQFDKRRGSRLFTVFCACSEIARRKKGEGGGGGKEGEGALKESAIDKHAFALACLRRRIFGNRLTPAAAPRKGEFFGMKSPSEIPLRYRRRSGKGGKKETKNETGHSRTRAVR